MTYRFSLHALRNARVPAIGLLLPALLALLFACPTSARSDACTASESCTGRLILSTGGSFPYYGSLPLEPDVAVSRAVFVIHGNRRDADRYYDHLVAAAKAEGPLGDTLLLAPNFRTADDRPAVYEHYWSSHGWKIGDKSRDRHRISSFAVMNEMLARVCPDANPLFPQLRTVVIVGHSAGGQFVNRYAAGGAGCPNPQVEVRYVVMNPSSYLYLDGRRRSGASGEFGIPGGCPKYDEYKYGLRDLNAYMKSIGPEQIRANLFTRKTYYLAGDEDTRSGSSLDTRCGAMLQGPQRLARHVNYRLYAGSFSDWSGAQFALVTGIGHSGGEMLMSETARQIVFR